MTPQPAILPKPRDAAMHAAIRPSRNTPKAHPTSAMPSPKIYESAGEIVGRRDLSDDVMLKAVAERLAFERRDPRQARTVLNAALAGKHIAVNFVRSLALPMPSAPLDMPIQALLDDKPSGGSGTKRRFLTFSW
ncbi:hypothetical protein GCM10011390_40370 [Aureimonas endophytica]|uniref:Uncharacterized protein n=1 Tax=Aureimonas endophytica TaxID=2027858 RepID=A0A916ZX72_9HYPH|nr:hypothetical protein [Aureimonas endophytica]GGE17188.1 hypothetical protein GCM10011390_40370 [Aureimonas endophytica]